MGTFDGPGLRLVVFLQGCPFRCLYCANPDTIDMSGGVPTRASEILDEAFSQRALFELTDLVLLDVKQFNPERHRLLTERDNSPTLRTARWLEEHGRSFWLRYVLVPGYSDFAEDIRALGEHFRDYKQIGRVEILPYHRLGVHKYEAMGLDYKLKDVVENTPEQLERAERLFKEYFDTVVVN